VLWKAPDAAATDKNATDKKTPLNSEERGKATVISLMREITIRMMSLDAEHRRYL